MYSVQGDNRKPWFYYWLIIVIIIMLLNALITPRIFSARVLEVPYSQFMKMTYDEDIGLVDIQTEQIIFTNKTEDAIYKTGVVSDSGLVDRLYEHGASFATDIVQPRNPLLIFLLTWILPFAIFYFIGRNMMKNLGKRMGGNALSFGSSKARVYVPSTEGIKFSDVAGVEEAKENLQEIVDFLHNPEKYKKVGAKMPKGVLLVGPPGTGKTMLAKAVAGEANVPFFSISGSEFVEMFVGLGASKVRDLFKQAKEKAPCIVFIDEIDAIGQKRGGRYGGNDEREQTLNQLLTEMDGFDGSDGVVILAATNRPETLDPALTRPGRFDRRVPVDLPDLQGREAILKVHAKNISVEENVDYNLVARMASGASGADLANIVNEAALRAVREGRNRATQADLIASIEVVIAGYEKKNAILSPEEKKIVAYHEVGHALVAALQSHSAPVEKITIVPRTSGALGYTMQVAEGNRYLMSKEELENQLSTLAGGRAAEELVFGSISTGASNDIEKMTQLARSMISQYGMSEKFGMMATAQQDSQYLGGELVNSVSPDTQSEVDREVAALIRRQYDKAKQMLEAHAGKLHSIAKVLYEQESITGTEFMSLLEHEE